MKVVQEATEEVVSYTCDRCGAENIDVDAKIETMDRDFQGGVVYSHWFYLCIRCRGDFANWMRAGVSNENR